MAAQFQSHVLENGQWVVRTTSANDLLTKPAMKPTRQKRQPPQCGIMTRTVVESPVVHCILPVRLRSPHHNDIAWIGDHYVDILELRQDLQLHRIARKNDFGSRIRNAKVIGNFNGDDFFVSNFQARLSRSKATQQEHALDVDMSDASAPSSPTDLPHQLPPQILVIILDTGDCVFLFLRPNNESGYDFFALQHNINSLRLIRPAFHLAVDPRSRYMVQACSRNLFIVHELNSMTTLNSCFIHGQPLKPVISSRPRTVNGYIHTVEFLYPRHQDPDHVILLLIVVNRGVPRMITYDWKWGDDLRAVLGPEKVGHKLPPTQEAPLLIIPLTVRTAFFAVSENEIAYCKDILDGSPSFEPCEIANFPPSEIHVGTESPLWTTWSRPPRLSRFYTNHDHIYIAREDGLVLFLECDSENILGAAYNHGIFCNVSTAFTSLAHHSNDILILGGDSGLGGVWKAPPREDVVMLNQIPNWSPTLDFVTTNESSRWDNHSGAMGKMESSETMLNTEIQPISRAFPKPDKIFAAAGRGRNGSIVEYRHGLRAHIGIQFDFGTVVKACFMLPANVSGPDYGHLLLLSLPGRSVLLRFDLDFSSTYDVDQDQSPYDLSSVTFVAMRVSEDTIIQVTERAVIFLTSSASKQFLLATLGLGDADVTDATVEGHTLAIAAHTQDGFDLHIISLDLVNLEAKHVHKEAFQGEVTCLRLFHLGGILHAVACLWWDNAVYLEFFCIRDQKHIRSVALRSFAEPLSATDSPRSSAEILEPFTSMVSVIESPQSSVLVAGSRDGMLLTLSLDGQCRETSMCLERVGSVPAYVHAARGGSAYVCSGSSFMLISDFREGKKAFARKQNVWTIDANDSSKCSPSITSVVVLGESLSGNKDNTPLLLLATDHVLLAEMQPQAGPVQRHIPLGMTPHKLLYSHVLNCLVVAATTLDDKPTLRFIDPETGDDLSLPVHGQTKESIDFIVGLGKAKDRILCLDEWHVESKNKKFYFVLVSTAGGPGDGGRVLIVSPRQEKPVQGQKRGKISFWTRHRIKGPKEPVYCVAAVDCRIQAAFQSALVYYRLDEGERRLTMVSTTPLKAETWKLIILPDSSHTLVLDRRESLTVLQERVEYGQLDVVHVDPNTPHGIDMLEVAGAWSPLSPPKAEPSTLPPSIVLVTDQECGLKGLWIPWEARDNDCDVVFEADLPSTVRRLRLGRTLPPSSREVRMNRRFGLLPASLNDAEILGMGIEGSLQHLMLLDLNVWQFLRFLQNACETSAEMYPFTYLGFASAEDEQAFDPRPMMTGDGLENQVDGDLMQRILDRKALERLIRTKAEWMGYFEESLDRVDGGRWTMGFKELATVKEKEEAYLALAYEILEYFLVPVI